MRIEGKDTPHLTGSGKSEKMLQKACGDFEAFFLSFVFKRAFVPLFGASVSREEMWFRELWIDEIAKKVSAQGGVGLGRLLFERLMREEKFRDSGTVQAMRGDLPESH